MDELMIPKDWSFEALGNIAQIVMGQSPDSKTYNTDREGLPFFQGNADFGAVHPVTRVWCNFPTKIAPKNSILFSVRAPVGEINIADKECLSLIHI